MSPKIIAFYFPQFHAIPENDLWWGKGFNDWLLVQNAKPLFKGHLQPKMPIDYEFYNPTKKETILKQVRLAKQYGIGGFMLYHYWFDGKLLLEKPLEVIRDNKDIDMPFCICWANETWTRTWAGKPTDVLIEQKHVPSKELWRKHFYYLLPFLKDSRALKKDGRPIIIIYQPHLIQEGQNMLNEWRNLAQKESIGELYIMAIKNYSFTTSTSFLDGYDAILKFQPREVYSSNQFKGKNYFDRMEFLRYLPDGIIKYLRSIKLRFDTYSTVDSDLIWKLLIRNAYSKLESSPHLDVFESGFFEWDNTPRYGKKARIYSSISVENKIKYCNELKAKAIQNGSPYIFWNAWNEWSEGACLEPDTIINDENLKIIHEVFGRG